MKKKVLVTGGAGFIGSELTKLLLAKKCDVTVFDNLSVGRREHIWPGIRLLRGDLRRPRDLKKISSSRFDVVFHLAALHFIPYCNEHPQETVDINVVATQHLLEALAVRPPKRLFFASTAAVYGPSDRRHRETELPSPMDIYGITKLAGEHLVRTFSKTHGTSVVAGRLFNAYGPRETNAHLIPSLLQQVRRSAKVIHLGNRKPYRDYMHTSDMAQAIYLLGTKPMSESFTTVNVGSGREYSVQEVLATFEKTLGRRLDVRTKPNLVRKVERMHLAPDLRRLVTLTGFKANVSFSTGIRELLGDLR